MYQIKKVFSLLVEVLYFDQIYWMLSMLFKIRLLVVQTQQ